MRTVKVKNISELLGTVITSYENKGDVLDFHLKDGRTVTMYHDQDCCESVYLYDIVGDLDDLIGKPLVLAEEIRDEPGLEVAGAISDESGTWTFYRFATVKGTVTLRWLGQSNGYYSENVDICITKLEQAS